MSIKFKFRFTLLVIFVLSSFAFAGTLPLNTGYDYSNFTTYPATTPDDYWIRLSSFPNLATGPAWAISPAGNWATPAAGPTGIPSTWINAFAPTSASPTGASPQNPAYAIYRKCFCLPQDYRSARIQGSVRNDDSIQIWVNLLLNQVLAPSQVNQTTAAPAYPINYAVSGAFRVGRNCIYVLVEDNGGATGFYFAGNLSTGAGTPLIAKGADMSFGSCSCASGLSFSQESEEQSDADDREMVDQIVRIAEQNRLEKSVFSPFKN